MPTDFIQLGQLKFLQFTFLGNSGEAWAIAFLVFLGALLAFKILQVLILGYLARLSLRTETDLDDTFIRIVRSVRPPFYAFVSVYVAMQFLGITPIIERILNIILLVWAVYQAATAVHLLIDYAIRTHVGYANDEAAESATQFLSGLAKWILWFIGALLVLSNIGVNITSLIAGLGIGGIAIAFALQNVLSDLFSSFAIYFDRPFVVGDVIQVGEFVGEVRDIGLKTTRVKAIRGEEIIFSNNQLTSDEVQNYGRMGERRNVFTLDVVYSTSVEKLRRVSEIAQEIITSLDNTEFDRAHFAGFGDSTLEIEVSYYVLTGDYNEHMDTKQAVYLQVLERLRKEGIELAYPTRTVYLKQE